MNQILQIFRKDVRHNRALIVLCLCSVVAYTWHYARIMGTSEDFHPTHSGLVKMAVGLFLPVSWFVLILRVIQSDGLVGDRQFWITRPLEWKQLLAAKALFLLMFINVPMLLAGVALLLSAHYSPAPYALGLLWMQVLLLQAMTLPVAALAVVTRTLVEALLTVVALVAFLIALTSLELVPHTAMASQSVVDLLTVPVLVVGSCGVILYQYACRRTFIARVGFGLGFALLFLIMLSPEFLSEDHLYALPPAGKAPVFEVAVGPPPPQAEQPPHLRFDEPVPLGIPLIVTGLPDRTRAKVKGVRLYLEGPGQIHWESDWMAHYEDLVPGDNSFLMQFQMKQGTFESLARQPVKARLTTALDVYVEGEASQVLVAAGEFEIPGVGRCRVDARDNNDIQCHSPMVRPPTTLLRLDPEATTCPVSETVRQKFAAAGPAYAFYLHPGDGREIAQAGFNPVQSFSLYPSRGPQRGAQAFAICPGTPLTVSFPQLLDRARGEVEIPSIRLESYRFSRHLTAF